MTKPFLISGIVGNSRMLVTLTGDGEIQRIFWPHIDQGQHVTRLLGGVSVNGLPVVWQDDPTWRHTQAYEEDQNILVTESHHPTGLDLRAVDATVPGRDLLVRTLTFANRSQRPMHVKYVLYQWIRVDENPLYNTAFYDEASDALVHYRRDVFLATVADRTMTAFAIGAPEAIRRGAARLKLSGETILHGDVAAAGLWDLGVLEPGAEVELSLFWGLGGSFAQARQEATAGREAGAALLVAETRTYWQDWLSRAKPLDLQAKPGVGAPGTAELPGLQAGPAPADEIQRMYRRSLLVFKLMSDEQTGAVIAAPEFDPAFTASGGYAYCWGRDAAYITVAMDLAGYHELAANFYRWAQAAQEPEGWWMHRNFTSGQWGPSWGLIQVDETGSILYGMARHAKMHGGVPFARSVWATVSRAANWLIDFLDPETGLPGASVDLWEERTSQLTYSSAAVFGGLEAAAELAGLLGETEAMAFYRAAAERLREAVLRECVRDGKFLRGRFLQVERSAYKLLGRQGRKRTGPKGSAIYEVAEDPVADASLLGVAVPFGVVACDDEVMRATAADLVKLLWAAPGGGLRRYVGDRYRGGNPWVLTTLWLGQYEAARGNRAMAETLLHWALSRCNLTGLLPEQVDEQTGRPVWVLPLTWSHAMFVLLALQLYGK